MYPRNVRVVTNSRRHGSEGMEVRGRQTLKSSRLVVAKEKKRKSHGTEWNGNDANEGPSQLTQLGEIDEPRLALHRPRARL